MDSLERNRKFFHHNPPRLFPSDPNQRPIIQGLLAQMAAVDPAGYEERLEKYNAMCDEKGIPRFARVMVVTEQEEPQAIPEPIEQPKKSSKKKKASLPPSPDDQSSPL